MTKMFRIVLPFLAALPAACGSPKPRAAASGRTATLDASYMVRDTVVPATLDAFGVAGPVERATLSTTLMGAVTSVAVHEGDTVRAGQVLARIDARELAARRARTGAAITEAEAVFNDAQVQAARMRALYADSAAPRAQLDAAETGLARARAAVQATHAADVELDAAGEYAVLRAPFAGVVTRRFVDPGAMATPGAPLVTVENATRLRITASAPPASIRAIRRGMTLDASIEGVHAVAVVEGVVPNPDGALYTVNALVNNPAHAFLAGGSAILSLTQGTRHAIFVPASAVVVQGDLTGVTVVTPVDTVLRWVRTGAAADERVEILSGLRPGERVRLGAAASRPAN